MKYLVILSILLIPVFLLLFGSRGCESVFPQDAHYEETEDEDFRRGKELAANGRILEAMEKFRQVVNAHPDFSAESNLEIGLLASKLGKCPTAIYHFERYLSLRPDSEKRDLVLKQIDAAKKIFVQQMTPGRNPEPADGGISFKLEEKYKAVVKENELLKRQIETLNRQLENSSVQRAGNAAPISAVPASPPPTPPAVAIAQQPPPPVQQPRVPATHTVVSGDTLTKISQKYYGTSARWREIYNANRVTMSDPGALKPGMVLKLPRP